MTSTNTVDAFEVSVVAGPQSSGTVADWELYFARRALARLKARLGAEAIQDLLRADIDAGNALISGWAAISDGKWQPSVTELRVTGLSASDFLSWLQSIYHDQPKMLAAQPEHFVYLVSAAGMTVIESVGPNITHMLAHISDTAEPVGEILPDYPIRIAGHITVPDGTVAAHFMHQFRDTDAGFDASLGLFFPQAAPEEVVEGHRKHLAVEFTNWITAAADALGVDSAGA